MYTIKLGSNLDWLPKLKDESIDLVVTSPPYDNLRTYNGTLDWNFDVFKQVANELARVIKKGGVIVWVVGDATVNGSETGSSFKQALYFKEVGLKLHDTMIYRKANYTPLTHNRYEQEWEYMFAFSKGKPTTFNPIKVPCKYAGQETWGKPKFYKDSSGELTEVRQRVIGNEKIKGNIFEYVTGSTQTGKVGHPAMFPLQLALDHVQSWSNEGDTVLDPFMGSGTTGVAAIELGRKFKGIELVPEYFEISKQRLEEAQTRIEGKGLES